MNNCSFIRMFRNITVLFLLITIFGGCPNFPRISPASVEKAWTYYENSEYERARREFSDVVASEPMNAEAYNGLGWCYGIMGELTIAIDDFDIAIEGDSLLVDPYAGLAFCYSDVPLDSEAINAASILVAKDSLYQFGHNSDITVSDVRFIKAKSLCNIGDFAGALSEVKKLDPSFDCDITTPSGRKELLNELEKLRGIV